MWMCSLYRLLVANNHNFGKFWLLGAPVPTPFYQWGPNLVCHSRPKVYTYTPNFIWMCSLCWLPVVKNSFGQISTFWGRLYQPPFTDEGEIWCAIADPPCTLTCQFRLNRFILWPFGGEKPQFLPFFGLRHLVVLPTGSSLTKLNTGAQLQTFPYPKASKSFLYSNAFMAKSGAQSLTFKSVTVHRVS